MKRLFLIFALLSSGLAQTPNIGLVLPAHGSHNWDVPLNSNFTTIDTVAGQLQLQFQGTWDSTITYAKGQTTLKGGLYYASIANTNLNHNPDTSPTFWTLVFNTIALKTNGTLNGSQVLLNLAAGNGMTLTDSGLGTVTFAAPLLKTSGSSNSTQTILNLAAGTGLTIGESSGTVTVTNAGVSALKTNGTSNGSQTVLNLISGSNITVTDGGSGNVTIANTMSSAFSPYATPTLPTSGSFTHQGGTMTITETDHTDRLTYAVPTQGTVGDGFFIAQPATPYTLTAAFILTADLADNTKFAVIGVGARETGDTRARWHDLHFVVDNANKYLLEALNWIDDGTVDGGASYSSNLSSFGTMIWLRFTDNGTTRTYYYSLNGKTWVTPFNEAVAINANPVTNIGFIVRNNQGIKVDVYQFKVDAGILGDSN